MTKRLNITLPDDVLERADAFARRQRYSRSGLIRAALEAFVAEGAEGADVVREEAAAYAPAATRPPLRSAAASELLRAFFTGREGVRAAWLFGSVARDETGPLSDVDVAVLFDAGIDKGERFDRRASIADALERVLRAPRVDVVSMNDASALLGHRVATGGVRVHDDGTEAAAEAEIGAVSRYIEYLPAIREGHRIFDERMEPYARPR